MKRIKVKRLVYYGINTGEVIYGGEEYDGNLMDDNILCSIHEVGKTQWMPANWRTNGYELYLLDRFGVRTHRIEVEIFYQFQKTWLDNLYDTIRRLIK